MPSGGKDMKLSHFVKKEDKIHIEQLIYGCRSQSSRHFFLLIYFQTFLGTLIRNSVDFK